MIMIIYQNPLQFEFKMKIKSGGKPPMLLALMLILILLQFASAQTLMRKLDADDDDGGKDDDGTQGQFLNGTDTSSKQEEASSNGAEQKDENQKEVLAKIRNRKVKANVPKAGQNDWESDDIKERIESGELKFKIDSITPRAGPITGGTRVTIRGPQIEDVVDAFPHPKCRYGKVGLEVDAAYVACTKAPIGYYDTERGQKKNQTCIECESAPKVDEEGLITFTVSLKGDFSEVSTSLPYRYYKPTSVYAIYPRYGPKDGDTVVQVWGENFLDLGDDFRCNFGTRSTKAHMISSNYIWCRAAVSDVVGRAMPFSVSINRQQNSKDKHDYWYYNDPSISKDEPDYGPMSGGTKVTLRGSGFYPFDYKLDINNKNDTFCAWGLLGKTPAEVISTTEVECLSPPNNIKIDKTLVNLTLNNQNYTDDTIWFYYFNPPDIMEATPLYGPVKGGTVVNMWGQKFEKSKKMVCNFNNVTVNVTWISPTQIRCVSPRAVNDQPGDVKLTVKYVGDRFQSSTLTFTYFDTPEILGNLEPMCGPVKGYTQVTVHGKNFLEFGFGKAKCIFNATYWMNATVISKTKLYCDSPRLISENGMTWYNVSVTLDGEYISKATGNFTYYEDPVIKQVAPWIGPLKGGTPVTVHGKGFNNSGICDLKVRYGQYSQTPTDVSNKKMSTVSPKANVPGQVVVSVSGNDQQWIDDITLHFRDEENTFEYYQNFIAEQIDPTYLSNTGNSTLTVVGMNFDQFKYDNGTKKIVPFWCRFTDSSNNNLTGMIPMKRLSEAEQVCLAPKTDYTGDANLELTVNKNDWHDSGHKVTFYDGPKVTAISPTQGVTKNPKNLQMLITGDNFKCPNNDCSKLKVRFMNQAKDMIIVKGRMTDNGAVICSIPKYPSPETLDVDVAFNGKDFTNDGVKYGIIDPSVLDIQPRLLSPKGTTKMSLTGYGFVQMEAAKSLATYAVNNVSMTCNSEKCSKTYTVLSENAATCESFEQAIVTKSDSKNIGHDAFNLEIMDPEGAYTPNDIDLYYYKEPQVSNLSAQYAFSNEEKPIIFTANFFWGNGNNYKIFKTWANLTCKFSDDNNFQIVTEAIFETTPIGQFKKDNLPNQIRCRTPQWNKTDTVKVELSVNGQDYFGNFQMKFVEKLLIHKISPMAGPLGGKTKVNVYSQGINSTIPVSSSVYLKFGTIEADEIEKEDVYDESWSSEKYYEEMHLSQGHLKKAEENDWELTEGQSMLKWMAAKTPDVSRVYSYTDPDWTGMGGPVFLEIGERITLNATQHDETVHHTYGRGLAELTTITKNIDVVFKDSSRQEFYFYRQPFVKKIQPTSGLVDGGTVIDLTGGWFMELPEYGVYPYCKIGDEITKAKFIQTNRIQCTSPASTNILTASQVFVSLNGVDWVDTGFTFSYYQKPILNDIRPRSGSIEGGTEIWLKGEKFSNITSRLKTVKCRFTQINVNNSDDAMIRYVPAYMIDKDTMKCASPAGFSGGDQTNVDLTFNGVDYTDNKYVFSFYSIFGSFPKSGPASGKNQFIQVRGKGFREDSTILCVLDNTKIAPISIKPGIIKCPMTLENHDEKNYTAVPFSIMIDGSKYNFGNFKYYKQITIDNVVPLIGPQEGRGAVYIQGKDFRDDFENAKLGCRIGNTLGHAQLIDSETIRCTTVNKLPLLDEGESLLVSAALNSYSWAASDYSMKPYGLFEIYPNSGPVGDSTNILVVGKGFENDLKDNARCRFGTDDNYAIVEAQVLDNEHMICRSPAQDIELPDTADKTISIPFAIAFQEDLYYPYTEGTEKFRLYQQPNLIDSEPSEARVGKLAEVYVEADETQPFWQRKQIYFDNVAMPMSNGANNDQYNIKCKFGRFGTSAATYINKTHILCLTPSISEDPAEISTETVVLSVAMNGVDFNEDDSNVNFTFEGTGGGISTWVIIMGTIIFGLLLLSIFIFLSGIQELMRARNQELVSNVVVGERGDQVLRVNSRAGSSRLGQNQLRDRSFGSRAGAGSVANRGSNAAFGRGQPQVPDDGNNLQPPGRYQ